MSRGLPDGPSIAAPECPRLDALSPLAKEVAQAIACVASDVALVIDRDGFIRSVAEGGTPLQASCGNWVGKRWVDTVSADTRRKIELLLDELGTGGISKRREVNHPCTDGDQVPMAWTAVRLGQDGPVLAVGRDLRVVAAIQRRFLDSQQELELDYWKRRHEDNRYRALFQVTHDAVLILDTVTFRIVEANDAAHALFGPLDDNTQPGSMLDRVSSSARAPLAELLASVQDNGRAGEVCLRLRPMGPSHDVSITPFKSGERRQLLVRFSDHGSGDTSAMMRSMVEATPDAVVITDSAGHILLANPAFLSLVQLPSEARVKGGSLCDLMGDPDGGWHNLLQRTQQQGLCARVPLQVRSSVLELAVEVSSTLLADGDQERFGFTLRTVEPPRPASSHFADRAWPELDDLRAQVGMIPLERLIREGSEVLERQIVRTALELSGGDLAGAARLLQMDARDLSLRLQGLKKLDLDGDDDFAPAVAPPRLN
jgi:transcriptional regulator PpsR